MIQEYLFTSDQYKADLENLSISPKVTKEITTIEKRLRIVNAGLC